MSGIKGLLLLSMVLTATYLGAQGAPGVEAAHASLYDSGEWLLACARRYPIILQSSIYMS